MVPDDLTCLHYLDDRTVLEAVKARHAKGDAYTYIGDVLLFVNPFKPLDIYSQERLCARADAKPHVFWTAQAALERMLATRHAQCVVVSGESGAGKTETIKQTVSHLTATATSIHPCLDVKINEVNPLLEAFGNARTTMNDNSSRFGKFLELRFTADGQLAGAVLSDYLLEKSRVVQQGPSERNFHIFYYMFAGMSREELRAYSLVAPEEYRILRQDNWPQPVFQSARDLDANRVLYHKQLNIMRLVGFTDWEVSLIFTLLSSILHVTNISFSREEDKENVQIKDTHSLSVGERVVKNKTVEQASDGRDALAKELLAEGPASGSWTMPGFENLKVNSFEQLCINVANEQVQRFFSEHVFVARAARVEYQAAGFLEKNRNSLSTALSDCMKGSYHTLVSDLFKAKVSRTGTISR
nr:hypothetical protein BaRGS_022659 [Batillaria attramentaria]